MRYSTTAKEYIKDKKISLYKKKQKPGAVLKYDYLPVQHGKLWAYYRHLSGNEYWSAKAVNVDEDVLFIINWRNDVEPGMHIVFRGKVYEITRVDDFEGYKKDLRLVCKWLPIADMEDYPII